MCIANPPPALYHSKSQLTRHDCSLGASLCATRERMGESERDEHEHEHEHFLYTPSSVHLMSP